jgi:CBS domain-containing protein
MAEKIQYGRGFGGLIDLPIVSGDITVSDALEMMVSAKRSAVIVNENRFHYLHTAKSVLGTAQAVYPTDRLHAVLSVTGAPYLPVINTIPASRWAELSPNLDALRLRGIIDAVPQKNIRIGGLITQSRSNIGQLLALRGFPAKDLAMTITKCVCSDGHRMLPEQLIGGLCPVDQLPVNCG